MQFALHRWRLLFLSLFFIVLFLEIWLGFPVNLERTADYAPLAGDIAPKSTAEKHMEGVHYVESRSGNRDWELFSETAEGSEGSGEWDLKNVKVLFYSGEKPEFTVTGTNGKIDAKTRDMKISGNVLVQSQNGYRFQTETINYLSENRLIKSVDKVKMTGPLDSNGKGIQVTGDWMEALVDKNLMQIKRNVLAQKTLNDGKLFTIKSGVAEFSGIGRSVHFFDQVSIEMDSMKLEGPDAHFEYGEPGDFLKNVSVAGGVKVSDLDKYATSDLVNFDPGQNRFTLQGKPRVVQNNDEITGDQIILIDGGKKVKVEKMKAHVDKLED